ncbi:hypothetical protein T484DRAFT_1834731 [Baffinella frigidus]|nr:hypothetical protein T484DRAFT_1834731 [Cryptophyta sp. CCMP2293]
MAKGSLNEDSSRDNIVYGAVPQTDIEAFGAVAPRRNASNRRAVVIAGAVAMAMAFTALIFVVATPGVAPATPAAMQWESLAQRSVRTSKLQEEEAAPAEEPAAPAEEGAAPAEEAPAEEAPAEEGAAPAEADAGPEAIPPARTEQMMNNGEVAAQGAGADFQNGEVVGAGVHVASGIGSGDGVTVGSGVINGQGVTVGSGEGMGTGMFAGSGEGTGMMVGIGSGVGSGHMITVHPAP